MFCKNCGKEIQENARFCTFCGSEQSVLQQNVQPAPQEAPTEKVVKVETTQQETVAPQQVETSADKTQTENNQTVPEPVQYQPHSATVQEPQQDTQTTPQVVPVQTETPQAEKKQSMFQPMLDLIKGFDFNKVNPAKNPKPIIYAGGVIALIVVLVVVGNIISNAGVKGLVNKMEDAINDGDVQKLKECYPDFMANDISSYDTSSFVGYLTNVEVEFDITDEEDITDSDYRYDSSYTWQQYIQNYYTGYSDYDGEKVDKVEKLSLKYDIDTDSSLVNFIANAADTNLELIVAKVDGDWVIYDKY